jgi:hypothetical protein
MIKDLLISSNASNTDNEEALIEQTYLLIKPAKKCTVRTS